MTSNSCCHQERTPSKALRICNLHSADRSFHRHLAAVFNPKERNIPVIYDIQREALWLVSQAFAHFVERDEESNRICCFYLLTLDLLLVLQPTTVSDKDNFQTALDVLWRHDNMKSHEPCWMERIMDTHLTMEWTLEQQILPIRSWPTNGIRFRNIEVHRAFGEADWKLERSDDEAKNESLRRMHTMFKYQITYKLVLIFVCNW